MLIEHGADGAPRKITMRKPFDFHHHAREGDMLSFVMPHLAKRFAGAVFMPNLVPPITTAARMAAYVGSINEAIAPHLPQNAAFRPLMTLYLTDKLEPSEIDAASIGGLFGVKYYPPGLTTNSDSGVENPASLWTTGTKPYECLVALARVGKALLLHAADGVDKNGQELDPYDQEKHFIAHTLPRIRDAHPDLVISVEHLSTRIGAEAARSWGNEKLCFTLTQHHLLLDRRDSFRRGFNLNRSWIPVIQRKEDRDALRELAGGGHPFVFLGTDSAPHPVASKYAACCAGGVMTAHAAIELYAEAFEDMGKLEELEAFASIRGPAFHGIRPSFETITLIREEWTVPRAFIFSASASSLDDAALIPFRAGEKVRWKLAQNS